ncbi:hypothetical protein AAC387_Pa12g2380 [Persea americana]
MDKNDTILVKMNGTNYITWSFHLKNFVEGKCMLGYLDGTVPKPVVDSSSTASRTVDEKAVATWNQNNAKVVTWILNSVDPSLSMSLQAFTKASDMWNHMKKLNHQTNKARKFHLDTELAKYCQVDVGLWGVTLPQALKLQEELHISQFLMNLCPEFEPFRAALMNQENSPNLDTCVQDVLWEEIRLVPQHSLMVEPKALLTTLLPPAEETSSFTSPGQKSQCFECNGYGHIARNCRKKLFCNYCKWTGHIISECKRRPPKRTEQPPQQKQSAFQPHAPLSQAAQPDHAETVTLTPTHI